MARRHVRVFLLGLVALLVVLTGRLEAQRFAVDRSPGPRPQYQAQVVNIPTARCRDGSYSYSQTCSGTCSYHGGVAVWYTPYCGLGPGAAPHARWP
jgi:hypothetical protein